MEDAYDMVDSAAALRRISDVPDPSVLKNKNPALWQVRKQCTWDPTPSHPARDPPTRPYADVWCLALAALQLGLLGRVGGALSRDWLCISRNTSRVGGRHIGAANHGAASAACTPRRGSEGRDIC